MERLVIAAFIGLIAFSAFDDTEGEKTIAEVNEWQPVNAPAAKKGPWYCTKYWCGNTNKKTIVSQSSSSSTAIIAAAESEYGVPAWYLHATWQIESSGLSGGAGKHWPRAADLAEPGSACETNRMQYSSREVAREWCVRQWVALQKICAQHDSRGEPVCDPDTVRTSWAFAMGPMQILPTNIVKMSAGGSEWSKVAADFDGDGAVNPMSLSDAMAMAAKLSRRFHDAGGHADDLAGWSKTADNYLGEMSPLRRAKLLEHAVEWCAAHDCAQHREEIASR